MRTPDSIPRLSRVRLKAVDCAAALFLLSAALFLPAAALASTVPLVPIHLAPMPPHAVFDYSPITSLKANPTITGSASSSLSLLDFKVVDKNGATVYQDPSVLIVGGRFVETVYPPIADGTYKLEMLSGTTSVATSTLTVGLRTELNIEPDVSIASYDVADGHLMRFDIYARSDKVRMHATRGVGINQLTFAVLPTNASVVDMQLYGYTDPNFTVPIIASTTGALNSVPAETDATSSTITIIPDEPIEIPSGATYYFDLVGTVTPSDTTYSVETTLLNDSDPHFGVFANLASTSNFVWSPNTYGTSSLDSLDWVNASLVTGIPQGGLIVVRTDPPPTGAPACSLYASTSTAAAGTPVTLTWSSTGATSVVWDSGAKDVLAGSETYTLGSTTHTYILDVAGPYGQSNCFATVDVPVLVATSTSTGTTATTTDGFTATPTTGTVTLAVAFSGSVNNNKSCAAQTFSLGYSDNSTSTITVPANLCKAQTFSFNHSYTKVGTSTAGLYKGTGTSTAQLIQKQAIVVKAKVAILFDPESNVANVFFAAAGTVDAAIKNLFSFFRW